MDANPPTMADLAYSQSQDNDRQRKTLEKRVERMERILRIWLSASLGQRAISNDSPEAREIFEFLNGSPH